MSNSSDHKHQFCFWGGLETTAPGQALGALWASPDPRVCPVWPCGSLPCPHPGLHPTGCPQPMTPVWLLASTEAAKRICVRWGSTRKTLWAEKGKQAVVPRHQVIWNKAGRSRRKGDVSVQPCCLPSYWLLQLPMKTESASKLSPQKHSNTKATLGFFCQRRPQS